MGMSVGGGKRHGGFTDINVTPLVDVMLVLLIVFMITAPLLATSLRVELPNVAAAEVPLKDTKLVVTVTPEERILFGEDQRDVTDTVEQVLASNPRIQNEKELYIRADGRAHYEVVARVVAAARKAGVEGLNLLVQPKMEEDASTAKVTAVADAPTSTPAGPKEKKKK
jgi:biopolymer transport protein TolR